MSTDSNYPYESVKYYFLGDDVSFRSRIAFLKDSLPPELERIRGFRQSKYHGGLDPVEHTLKLMNILDTEGLSAHESEILRVAALFHDTGKEDVPYGDSEHPNRSAIIAGKAALKMGYPIEDVYLISKLVKTHVHLAEYVCGRITAGEVLTALDGIKSILTMHHRLIKADTISRPCKPNRFSKKIDTAYIDLVNMLCENRNR